MRSLSLGITACLCSLLLFSSSLFAVRGKVDGGPVKIEIDIVNKGKKERQLDFTGGSINGSFVFGEYGFCLKPKLMAASGEGETWNAGIGAGVVLPLDLKDYGTLYTTPSAGIAFGELNTHLDMTSPLVLNGVSEVHHTQTPYVGIDFAWSTNCKLMFSFMYQYGWSRSHTVIKHSTAGTLLDQKTEAAGSNYAFQVDYYYTDNWSVNAAYALNTSYSKEKNGFEAHGYRIGVGRSF
jgi:hypothetical protein